MIGRTAIATAALAVVVGGLAPGAASAKLSAKASIVVKDGAARIVVEVKTTKTLKASERIKKAKVKIGAKTYPLTKVAGKPRTFQGRKTTPPGALLKLVGRKAIVKLTTFGGRGLALNALVSPASVAPAPSGPAGSGTGTTGPGSGPAGPTSLFDPPGKELSTEDPATKDAASAFLLKYFANSTFTTCSARWPDCAVEEFYDHCASGAWHYARLTPNSGSDIRSYGTISVVGAVIHADGSWIVRYGQVSNGGTPALYEWGIDTRGIATGAYQYPAGTGQTVTLNGPFAWRQPVTPDPYTGEHTCA